MKYVTYIHLGLLAAGLCGCSVEAQQVNFGQDQCHYCKMAIVDRRFAALSVTNKGKQFNYDATECMVNEIRKNANEPELSIIRVRDYTGGGWTEASKATYLISPRIKSPMGAFLAAFSTSEAATKARGEYGGEVYDWPKLKEKLSSETR